MTFWCHILPHSGTFLLREIVTPEEKLQKCSFKVCEVSDYWIIVFYIRLVSIKAALVALVTDLGINYVVNTSFHGFFSTLCVVIKQCMWLFIHIARGGSCVLSRFGVLFVPLCVLPVVALACHIHMI